MLRTNFCYTRSNLTSSLECALCLVSPLPYRISVILPHWNGFRKRQKSWSSSAYSHNNLMIQYTILHTAFLYVDIRYAIKYEDGPHVIRHWKIWLTRFLGGGGKNYSAEAVELIANIHADLPRHISYIAVNNRTVNVDGKAAT